MKKAFPFIFMLIVVVPIAASFGIWNEVLDGEDTYAVGTTDVIAEKTDVSSVEDSVGDLYTGIQYEFKMNEDKDIYDHNAEWTFNGEKYKGVYTSDFKSAVDNELLKIQDLGTPENPYVILEVSPDSSISQLRPHIGDRGYYDLTAQEVADIQLSEEETYAIKLQALYSLDYSDYSKKYVKTRTAELKADLAEKLASYDKIQVTVTADNFTTVLEDRLTYVNNRLDNWNYPSIDNELNTLTQTINSYKWSGGITAIMQEPEYLNDYNAAAAEYDRRFAAREIEYLIPYWEQQDALNQEKVDLTEERNQIKQAQTELAPIITELKQLETYVFDFVKYLNGERVNNDIATVVSNLESIVIDNGILTKEEYNKYVNIRIEDALSYKIKYEKTLVYYKMFNNQQNKYAYDYVKTYAVDSNGNFKTFNAGDTKTILSPDELTDINGNKLGNTVSALQGEYEFTNDIMNPLNMQSESGKSGGQYFFNDGRYLVEHNNTFVKSCLDIAYNSTLENGVVVAQEPYIDEYIFTGWSIMDGGELVSVASLPDDYDLSGVSELYTNWVIRKYEDTEYKVLATESTIEVEFKSSTGASYIVHVPSCVASANSDGVHDVRNQLSICTVDSQKRLLADSGFTNFRSTGSVKHYVLTTSAWDFDFSKTKYSTVADLKKVAPKLLADTDYYVLTRNQVVTAGKVTYYPYNVMVITITPEELNKMVYYDEAYYGKSKTVGYQESEYLNKFLDNVDFIFFSNGGTSYYTDSNLSKLSANNLVFFTNETRTRIPALNKAPSMYSENGSGELVYDSSLVNYSMSYKSNMSSIPDLEWQVVDKVYKRVAIPRYNNSNRKTQSRSMVVIFDESLGDGVSTLAGATANLMDSSGNYIGGTECNLAKLMLMFFSFKDSADFYNYYVDEDYYMEGVGNVQIKFDKITGVERTVGDNDIVTYNKSYYTGELYNYEKWNTALFLPYEVLGYDHYSALSSDPVCAGFKPENGQLGKIFFEAFGLSAYSNYKEIANPYAYTYNGDTSLSSSFFTYNRPEISNPTNGYADGNCISSSGTPGNSDLAFDYFRRVKPWEIKNGMISTKSCIEYMVQNAQMGYTDINDRRIVILNKIDTPTRMTNPNGVVYVDTIIVDDFNRTTDYIDYKYESPTVEGFFVPEILWTERYYDYDNNNDAGLYWYLMHTNEVYIETGNLDAKDKWYIMPEDLDNDDKDNYYMSKLLTYAISTDEYGNEVATPNRDGETSLYKYFDSNNNLVTTDINYINDEVEYYAEVLLKPIIENKTKNQRTYIVAVKQYRSYEAYKAGMQPEVIILKNVMLEKLSYLFNLD